MAKAAKKQSDRQAMLAKVHIAVKELGYSDETYRDILYTQFKARSAAGLTLDQLDQLIRFFVSKGWHNKISGKKPEGRRGTMRQLGKITALLAAKADQQRGPVPWNYALAILKRQCGVERFEWATSAQLQKVIASLEYDAKRKGYHRDVNYKTYADMPDKPLENGGSTT
jgi:phage gp16-like protein